MKRNKIVIGMNAVVFVSAAIFSLSLLALTFYISYDRVRSSESVIGSSSVDLTGVNLDGPPTVAASGQLWRSLLIEQDLNEPVLLVYMDYECPFTERLYEEVINPLITGDEVFSYGVINYTQQFHPQSEQAAVVAECILDQDGFAAYSDYVSKLFDNDISRYSKQDYLDLYASDLNVSCLDVMQTSVQEDTAEAKESGVNTTPTVFIGEVDTDGNYEGEFLTGVHGLEEYVRLLDKYRD